MSDIQSEPAQSHFRPERSIIACGKRRQALDPRGQRSPCSLLRLLHLFVPTLSQRVPWLLVYCMQLLTGEQDLGLSKLSSPVYEGSLAYICANINNGEIRVKLPDVPPERYTALKCAEESQLRSFLRSVRIPARPAPTLPAAPLPNGDKQW